MAEAREVASPPPGRRTRGVSARGLGVRPVSATRERESNVPGRRPPAVEVFSSWGIEASLLMARGIRAGLGMTH